MSHCKAEPGDTLQQLFGNAILSEHLGARYNAGQMTNCSNMPLRLSKPDVTISLRNGYNITIDDDQGFETVCQVIDKCCSHLGPQHVVFVGVQTPLSEVCGLEMGAETLVQLDAGLPGFQEILHRNPVAAVLGCH